MLGSASVPAGSRVFANILEANLDASLPLFERIKFDISVVGRRVWA